ncbi:MAG: hypothetical protein AB7P99_19855 [Vicinamibacterales bacterium]
MLLNRATLAGIRAGTITLAFRRWRRPTVRTGGTLLTAIGRITIRRVSPVERSSITPADARRAGHASRDALLAALRGREGQLYRIDLGEVVPDPRVALRAAVPDAADTAAIIARLTRMDRAAAASWTRAALELIADSPGVRAGDLADRLGMERLTFKANVRRLKALGLTISREVGYELAPRGRAVLRTIRKGDRKRPV